MKRKIIKLSTLLLTHLTPLILAMSMLGCAEPQINEPNVKEPPARVFKGDFEQVWRAIQLAMRKYPVRLNNIDAGILETEYISGAKIFWQPADPKPKPGLRYKITVRAVKGQVDKKQAIKVTLFKSAELQHDFFSGFQPVSSNGLEELALLYRIGRYIEIDNVTAKAAKTPQKETSPSPKADDSK